MTVPIGMGGLAKSWEWGGERIPIGILYQVQRPTLADQHREVLRTPLVRQERDWRFVQSVLATYKV